MIKQRIFVVEDDPKILGWVVAHLEADGYNPSAFSSSAAALEQLGRSAADMVILAFSLPEYNGIQLVRRIREMSEVPIMMISLNTICQLSLYRCHEAKARGVATSNSLRHSAHGPGSQKRGE